MNIMGKINKHKFGIDLTSILSLFIFCIAFIVASPLNAAGADTDKNAESQEQKETPPAKTSRVLMRDSQTGYAVFPDEITIIDTKTNKTVYHKTFTKEEAVKEFKGGVFPAMPDLPPGSYQYTIQAKGYKPITSHFDTRYEKSTPPQQVPGERPLESITFFMTPIETPPELKYEVLKQLSRWDSSVLVGFVVDDETGLPISGATVGTVDGKISAKTNERGFFMIRFPLPPGYAGSVESPVLVSVIYEKNGYRSKVEERHELMPTDVRMTRVWLKPGRGKIFIDEKTKIERIEP